MQVVRCRPDKYAPPAAIRQSAAAIPAVPSKAPLLERFEWGQTELNGSSKGFCFMATFKEPQHVFDATYQQALDELQGIEEPGRPYVRTLWPSRDEFLFHDATPQVQATPHRCLRRVVRLSLKSGAGRAEMQTFEDAITVLPKQIPAIKRLEWGTHIIIDPRDPKPLDPTYRDGLYCILFTFDDERARDACFSHPAYKAFQEVLNQYVSGSPHQGSAIAEWEYIADVEYIARAD